MANFLNKVNSHFSLTTGTIITINNGLLGFGHAEVFKHTKEVKKHEAKLIVFRTVVLNYGPNEMRSVQKTKVRTFFVWNKQLINKSFAL